LFTVKLPLKIFAGKSSRQKMSKEKDTYHKGRLQARPGKVTTAGPVGLQHLGLDAKRDALLYVPAGYNPAKPAPMALMFHGAGGRAETGLNYLQPLAEQTGLILLATSSRRSTWDVITFEGYGPDIEFVDQALALTFERYAIDVSRLAVGGFSDGASYALSVGLTNGDLFSHILAFSPGFIAPSVWHGKPAIFITHGLEDKVLPIDACSRKLVPGLKAKGYNPVYHEFDGPHTIPVSLAFEALEWLLDG
jgi:phospholipase/carboxylesterase